MLAARGHNETSGKPLYVLALAPEDVARLTQGLPLHTDAQALGLYAEVLICAGLMAEEITRLMGEEG